MEKLEIAFVILKKRIRKNRFFEFSRDPSRIETNTRGDVQLELSDFLVYLDLKFIRSTLARLILNFLGFYIQPVCHLVLVRTTVVTVTVTD